MAGSLLVLLCRSRGVHVATWRRTRAEDHGTATASGSLQSRGVEARVRSGVEGLNMFSVRSLTAARL